MEKQKIRNGCLLFLTSIIWGISFVAQSVGMEHVGPFTFTGVRCTLGGIVLLPYIAIRNRIQTKEEKEKDNKTVLVAGLVCGVLLFLGTMFQQTGIMTTSAGKAGFLTALYIILVPMIGLLFGKKAGIRLWISVLLSLGGLYLLCMKESFVLRQGDILLIIGAVVFSVHILAIDHFTNKVDGVKMSCIQFFVCGLLGIVCMFIFEEPKLTAIINAWQPIIYSGALSCGIGYTLQIVGQKGMNPTVASLLLSLESVNAAIAGWLILGQKLSQTELFGCLLVFIGIIIAQLPNRGAVSVNA